MAGDGALTVAKDLAREHSSPDYFCKDLDRTWSFSELLLAVDHKVVDAVEEVTHVAVSFLYNLLELVKYFPLDW